jgi:hypothetical protein
MQDPSALGLIEADSQALMQAMQPYFSEDGLTLHWLQADTWLVEGETLRGLATASLEQVRSQPVDRWMPRQDAAKLVRRLQNEMQMLLYTHPINDARAAKGLPTINSFWISGTGELPSATAQISGAGECTVRYDLRSAAIEDYAADWLAAWQTLDTNVLARLYDQPNIQLTLCGENQAHTFGHSNGPWWRTLQRQFSAPTPAQLLSQCLAPL